MRSPLAVLVVLWTFNVAWLLVGESGLYTAFAFQAYQRNWRNSDGAVPPVPDEGGSRDRLRPEQPDQKSRADLGDEQSKASSRRPRPYVPKEGSRTRPVRGDQHDFRNGLGGYVSSPSDPIRYGSPGRDELKLWEQAVRRTKTVAELTRLVREKRENLQQFSMKTFLSKMNKLSTVWPHREGREDVLEIVAAAIEDELTEISMEVLIDVLTLVCAQQKFDPGTRWWGALVDEFRRRLKESFQPMTFAWIFTALSQVRIKGDLRDLVSDFAQDGLYRLKFEMHTYDVKTLGTLLTGCAKLGLKFSNDELVRVTAQEILRKSIHPNMVAHTLGDLAKLEYPADALLEDFIPQVYRRYDGMNLQSKQRLLWAFAKMSYIPPGDLLDRIAEDIAKGFAELRLKDIPESYWKFAKLGYDPGPELKGMLSAAMVDKKDQLTDAEVDMILSAAELWQNSTEDAIDTNLVGAMMSHVVENVAEFGDGELARILGRLDRLGMRGKLEADVLEAFCARMQSELEARLENVHALYMANSLRALSRLAGGLDPRMFEVSMAALEKHSSDISDGALLKICEWVPESDDESVLVAALNREAQRRRGASSSAQATGVGQDGPATVASNVVPAAAVDA